MLSLKRFDNIFIYREFVDFRKGINGLCLVVQEEMNLNPLDNYLFIFCNNKRDKVKAIYWDFNGFAMWYKCLDSAKYKWPIHLDDEVIKINIKEMHKFLKGFNPWESGHKKLNFSHI